MTSSLTQRRGLFLDTGNSSGISGRVKWIEMKAELVNIVCDWNGGIMKWE